MGKVTYFVQSYLISVILGLLVFIERRSTLRLGSSVCGALCMWTCISVPALAFITCVVLDKSFPSLGFSFLWWKMRGWGEGWTRWTIKNPCFHNLFLSQYSRIIFCQIFYILLSSFEERNCCLSFIFKKDQWLHGMMSWLLSELDFSGAELH